MDFYEYADVALNYDNYMLARTNQGYNEHDGYLDFYFKIAKKYGNGGVLDVGCGTGELLIHLLNHGIEADGLDVSKTMCNITTQRAKNVGKHVNVFACDITKSGLSRKYSLITMTRGTFSHLYNSSLQRKGLIEINNMLITGGVFVFDLFDPWPPTQAVQMNNNQKEYDFWVEYLNKDGNREKIYQSVSYNPYTQQMSGSFLFETYDDTGEIVGKRVRPILMKQTYRTEMCLLAELCGFSVVGICQGYSGLMLNLNKTSLINKERTRPIWILKKVS